MYEKVTGMSRSQGLRHEPPSSHTDFLDDALVIGYDGSNMPYVMFKN